MKDNHHRGIIAAARGIGRDSQFQGGFVRSPVATHNIGDRRIKHMAGQPIAAQEEADAGRESVSTFTFSLLPKDRIRTLRCSWVNASSSVN